ncbi:MAG TPA: SgcJ/EcaC family oxidoreductase, partial [Pirellulales bacterium]|nr:SgcJ/EcaC family oxidoreductase [Pirellulales bacterium]
MLRSWLGCATMVLGVCSLAPGQVNAPAKKPTAPPASGPAATGSAPSNKGAAPGKTAPAGKTGPQAPVPGAAAAEAAVRKASRDYLVALNSGDFKAAAAFWTADGVYVDPSGRSMKAQRVVAEELGKRFAGAKKPQLALDVKSLRVLTSDSVLEEGIVDVQSPEGAALPRGRFSTVWVKQQDKWLIKSVHEPAPSALTHYFALSQLGWLVGNWTAEAEGYAIHIHCAWTPGHAYLVREISVSSEGKLRHSVTQRIGLDPMSPKIKSWSFDADGGMAEAFWDKSGDSWHVFSRGASRDGQVTSARNIYRDVTADSYTLESAEAHAGSRSLPEFKLKFSRGPADENEPTTAGNNGTEPSAAQQSAGTQPSAAPQQGPAAQQSPTTTSATQAQSPSSGSSETDSLLKERILNSAEWRQTQQAYNEWLSVQKIYTPAEVKQLKAATSEKIGKMTAAQLADFVEDSKEKLAI